MFIFCFAFTFLLKLSYCGNWAVLLASSNGWTNYRHQSDVFRTYKILIRNGFDPNHIITMAYDDVAHMDANPFPEQIFNFPDGPDVYIGSNNIDYRGADVTPEKYLAVITGDSAKANGKVLNSTKDDNVYLYLNDHGAYGVLIFPEKKKLYSQDLNEAIKSMYLRNMYKNLYVNVEACYSGSLFLHLLPLNINAYATTASNQTESSYAAFCSMEKYQYTCLSNEYSQNFHNFIENNDLKTISIDDLFSHSRDSTKKSHPKEYGSQLLKKLKTSAFLAGELPLSPEAGLEEKGIHFPTIGESGNWKHLKQQEVHMKTLEMRAKANPFGDAAIAYHKELTQAKQEEKRYKALSRYFGVIYPDPNFHPEQLVPDLELYRRALDSYEERCGSLNEHNLWPVTSILLDAVCQYTLNNDNFDEYLKFLRSLN
ncbi:putative peptidase C13 family protein [Monocercomonoides exilis]|uniref:putative peptidase C13 family protein n=1 Tax=Monocercomonoides exilis TaxID=2049356 RepID=UPI00355A76BA|nr:putative peptidase C13 family protein [Monocercomonoides exilis]|eukprot:MONOS_1084.1-p1 / transcript=MONOS_1084.1 / gene=MONOS_1084 / organism=Monocercomonoides_exilis_PA203 / gene_product=legumain / transcript_product=legumain / location=Mono_scaffold00018:142540-143817(+) / protein_length=425 / sequence_SO=supercontig / SO=protein_coding / is_pseudo=false